MVPKKKAVRKAAAKKAAPKAKTALELSTAINKLELASEKKAGEAAILKSELKKRFPNHVEGLDINLTDWVKDTYNKAYMCSTAESEGSRATVTIYPGDPTFLGTPTWEGVVYIQNAHGAEDEMELECMDLASEVVEQAIKLLNSQINTQTVVRKALHKSLPRKR